MKNVSIPQVNNDITVNDFLDIRFLQMPLVFYSYAEMLKEEGKQYRVVTTSPYVNMSDRSKSLYALFYDRAKLSNYRYNAGDSTYVDENLSLYILFTIENIKKALNCSKNPAIDAKKELAAFGLIREVNQGANKPNLIYVQKVNLALQERRYYRIVYSWKTYKSGRKVKVKDYILTKIKDCTGRVIYDAEGTEELQLLPLSQEEIKNDLEQISKDDQKEQEEDKVESEINFSSATPYSGIKNANQQEKIGQGKKKSASPKSVSNQDFSRSLKNELHAVQNLNQSNTNSSKLNYQDYDTNRYADDLPIDHLSMSDVLKTGQFDFLSQKSVKQLALFGEQGKNLINKIYQAKRAAEKEYGFLLSDFSGAQTILGECWSYEIDQEITKFSYQYRVKKLEGKPIQNLEGYFYSMMFQFWKLTILCTVQFPEAVASNYRAEHEDGNLGLIQKYYPERNTKADVEELFDSVLYYKLYHDNVS